MSIYLKQIAGIFYHDEKQVSFLIKLNRIYKQEMFKY